MRVIDGQGRQKITPGFPIGAIIPFYGTSAPDGWALCDGTGGTPDLRDRFVVGDTTVGTGTAGGVTSPWTAYAHAGSAVANHAAHGVTQPAAHSDHVPVQPSAHSAHTPTQPADHGTHATAGAHTHDAHTAATSTVAGVAAEVRAPPTHASQGGHTHNAHAAHTGMAVDAHSAHTGMAVDSHSAHAGWGVDAHSAHSVTQPGVHSVLKNYIIAYVMRVS